FIGCPQRFRFDVVHALAPASLDAEQAGLLECRHVIQHPETCQVRKCATDFASRACFLPKEVENVAADRIRQRFPSGLSCPSHHVTFYTLRTTPICETLAASSRSAAQYYGAEPPTRSLQRSTAEEEETQPMPHDSTLSENTSFHRS